MKLAEVLVLTTFQTCGRYNKAISVAGWETTTIWKIWKWHKILRSWSEQQGRKFYKWGPAFLISLRQSHFVTCQRQYWLSTSRSQGQICLVPTYNTGTDAWHHEARQNVNLRLVIGFVSLSRSVWTRPNSDHNPNFNSKTNLKPWETLKHAPNNHNWNTTLNM